MTTTRIATAIISLTCGLCGHEGTDVGIVYYRRPVGDIGSEERSYVQCHDSKACWARWLAKRK